MKLRALAAAAAVMSLAASGAARAEALHFVYSDTNGADFSFNMDSHPVPDSSEEPQIPIGFDPFSPPFYLLPGSTSFNSPASVGGITFYTAGLIFGGGLSTGDGSVNMFGDVVFDGDPSTPEFHTGTFNFQSLSIGIPEGLGGLSAAVSFYPQPEATGTLVVTDLDAVSSAPEPGTWALMLGGIGILGGVLRLVQARRREQQFA